MNSHQRRKRNRLLDKIQKKLEDGRYPKGRDGEYIARSRKLRKKYGLKI
ncbi:MAG: hypothetical protein M0R17_02045 [Candidatus Omnitrophica bacterium]|jgi:hypothetical protein|nr:hypothetical protein [Candidatus Omnitrophota bacterium]